MGIREGGKEGFHQRRRPRRPRRRPRRLARTRVVLVNELLHVGTLALLRLEATLLRDIDLPLRLHVCGDGPLEVVQPLALQLDHVRHHRVEEAAVVRDDQRGRRARAQPVHQPVHGREVQMVGWLIE